MSGGVWGVAMMRDEADVAVAAVTHLLEEGLDGVLVLDNRSTDGTGDLLRDLSARMGRITVMDDPDPAYYQSKKMTRLARLAREHHGAEWIVPFDADEVWYSTGGRLGDVLRSIPAGDGPQVIGAPLFNHFPSSIDPDTGTPFADIGWRQPHPGELPKVCFRWDDHLDQIDQGNHSVTIAGRSYRSTTADKGVLDRDVPPCPAERTVALRHFPYRTFDQFARKARNGAEAYAATDLPDTTGAHWRQYGRILDLHGPDALREVYETWFWHLAPVEASLIHDPAPWCRWS